MRSSLGYPRSPPARGRPHRLLHPGQSRRGPEPADAPAPERAGQQAAGDREHHGQHDHAHRDRRVHGHGHGVAGGRAEALGAAPARRGHTPAGGGGGGGGAAVSFGAILVISAAPPKPSPTPTAPPMMPMVSDSPITWETIRRLR